MNWKSISFRPDDKRFVFVIFCFHFHYFNGHFHLQYVRYISSSAFENLMRINKAFQLVYWCLKFTRVFENFQVNHSIYHKHTQNFVFLIKISREEKTSQNMYPFHRVELKRITSFSRISFFSFHFISFTIEKATAIDDVNGPWPAKRRRNSIYKNMGLLCCVSRPNYLWKEICT